MGVLPKLNALFIICTFRITWIHYTYWCPAPSAVYDLLGLLTELLDYTRLLDAPPKILPLFLSSTFRITELNYTYGYATLCAAYVGYL